MARVHRLTLVFGLLSAMAAGPPAGARTQETPKKDQDQKTQEAPSKKDFSVMDAGVGPCSVELSVTDADGKLASAALISVHVAYGFAGVRKLDLSVYTNDQGKAKFTGLPSKVHKPPVEFHASKDQATGTAIYDPGAEGECQAKHNIELHKPKTDTDSKPPQE
ncbi:MAG TPA: hypothetical protein VEU31_09470 [Candidatus Acidoferrales bacterium]|nr:hypothetical protein [Candidatus Acidoferrales bacterium]